VGLISKRTITFLEQLKKKSPCPVQEVDGRDVEFIRVDGKRTSTVKQIEYYAGRYIHPSSLISQDGRIEIKKKMTSPEKEGTLSHEMGHARCHKNNCKCYTKYNRVLQEIHAELYALHLLLRHGKVNALKVRFDRLRNDWNGWPHCEAKAVIRNRRIYKRCQEFVENYDLLFVV